MNTLPHIFHPSLINPLINDGVSSSHPLCPVLVLLSVRQNNKRSQISPLLPLTHLGQVRHEDHKGVVEGDEGDEDGDVAVAVGEGVAVL